jgi:cytochrome c peroxidase
MQKACLNVGVAAAILALSPHSRAADVPAPDYGLGWQQTGRLEAFTAYDDPTGKIGVLLADGPVTTKNHPFFRPTGPSGRSCATCHAPENGMGLSTDSLQARWKQSGEADAVFASIDGANCPNLPKGAVSSHSLLLNRGVFRISLPWPPRDSQGVPIRPEFDIEVVRDPTGCNTDPKFGLSSADPHISVYRRPRITANLKYILNFPNEYKYGFNVKTAFAQPRAPDGQGVYSMNLMADARFLTLDDQHEGAIKDHMPGAPKLSKKDMDTLVRFTRQIYAAQVQDRTAGSLIETGGPSGLGPYNLLKADVGFSGEAIDTPVFQRFDQWQAKGDPESASEADRFHASVARGQDIFITRTFFVRDVAGINTLGVGNPAKRACALCHNGQMTGHDLAPGWMNIGTTNWPWAKEDSDLPLFKLTCRRDVPAHPYLGRIIYTNDPGRALVSGRCSEIGMITMQQFRGLAARAPYFSNGSAKTLREVVDFYDRRFQIGYSEQEKQDLVNFLSVL